MGGAAAEPGGLTHAPGGYPCAILTNGMRTWTSLLLLLTLALTLGLGAHPCGAEAEPAGAQGPAAMPSCHMQAAPATPATTVHAASRNHDCCGTEQGSAQPCPHLCHATALPVVTAPFLADPAAVPLAAVSAERALATPVRSIDHVPLA